MHINRIVHKARDLLLTRPLQIEVSRINNIWILTNTELDIVSYGNTYDIALESFKEDFVCIWEIIGKEENINLDSKAIEIKNILQELVVK